MIRLKIPLIPNEIILNKLFEKNIFTVNDFLQKNNFDLQNICNLQWKEITKLKDHLTIYCSSSLINGYKIYLNNSVLNFIKTGIPKLDNLLEGGLLCGNIYELCGPSACGKTQLCFNILLNITVIFKKEVIYIDTKNEFSITRIKQILKNKYNMTNHDMKAVLKKIHIYSISNIYCLITTLHSLTKLCEPIIIIDSLPALYLAFVGFYSNDGLCFMNHICNVLKYLCMKNASILLTNLAVKNCNLSEGTNSVQYYDFKPAIGKYWFHVPNTRLMCTKISNQEQLICVNIVKSVYLLVNKKCTLIIDDRGIS